MITANVLTVLDKLVYPGIIAAVDIAGNAFIVTWQVKSVEIKLGEKIQMLDLKMEQKMEQVDIKLNGMLVGIQGLRGQLRQNRRLTVGCSKEDVSSYESK